MSRRQHRRPCVSVAARESYGGGRAASSSRRGRVGSLVLASLAVAAVSSGCTSDSPAPGPLSPLGSEPPLSQSAPVASSPAPPASPTVSDEDAIRAAYATFMDARNVSLNDPRKPPDRRLWQVSIPPARDGVYSLVLHYRVRKLRVVGGPASTLSNLKVNGDSAQFKDCVDSRNVDVVFARTGESALSPGQSRIVPVDVDLVRADVGWQVKHWLPRRGEEC